MAGTGRIPDDALAQAAATIKCVGHPLRLRLLEALDSGEKAVTELQRHSGADQAKVSEHLGILRGRGLVAARRDGSFVRYHITEPKVSHILECIRSCGSGEGRRRAGRRSGGATALGQGRAP